jgi:predicted nucleotide-binding protein
MNLKDVGTDELIRLAKTQLENGTLDDAVLHELQARYVNKSHSPSERTAIFELDRSVFVRHFGHTKLPPGIVDVAGAKATRSFHPNTSDSTRQIGQSQPEIESESSEFSPAPDKHVVFVVHGRNQAARDSMFQFLRAIGLQPLEWSQAIAAVAEGSPYVGDILDQAFSMAQAVVVLMTPDDEACLRKEFQTEHDADFEKRPSGQARPNVLFEAGMAMGRDSKRTVLVEMGLLRPFSDIGGRHVVRMNNSSERRQDLAERLRKAGCHVDLNGRRDWHTAGCFELEPVQSRNQTPIRKQLSMQFIEHDGVLWKQGSESLFEKYPYCPRCESHGRMMSFPSRNPPLYWLCSICSFQVNISAKPPV